MFTFHFLATQFATQQFISGQFEPARIMRLAFGRVGHLDMRNAISQSWDFPTFDKPTMAQIELPSEYSFVDLGISIGRRKDFSSQPYEDKHTLYVSNLGRDDSLVATAVAQNLVVGNILHGAKSSAQKCEVHCADGTSSQECITCKLGDVYMRLCC